MIIVYNIAFCNTIYMKKYYNYAATTAEYVTFITINAKRKNLNRFISKKVQAYISSEQLRFLRYWEKTKALEISDEQLSIFNSSFCSVQVEIHLSISFISLLGNKRICCVLK